MAYLTMVCGATELTLPRVWTCRHKVPGGGVGVLVGVLVGVGVPVGVDVGVDVAVAAGDLTVPPGVRFFSLGLCAGAGCGSEVPGEAGWAGLGCSRAGGLAPGLGWLLGNVLGGVGGGLCAARRPAGASSTGMPAGGCRRPPQWLAGARSRQDRGGAGGRGGGGLGGAAG